MTGLQFIEALTEGHIPPPPIAELIGIQFVHADLERVEMMLEVTSRLYNPMGTLHGGVLCDIGDAAMGYAIVTSLAKGETFTTVELKINFFKPVRSGNLRATGKVVRSTRNLRYAECEISDVQGSLVAKLASTCMVLRGNAAIGR